VTALLPDIVGSTSLSERMDPEDFDAVIGEAIARMTTVAENYGGEVHEHLAETACSRCSGRRSRDRPDPLICAVGLCQAPVGGSC
jgi:class 3 adenylate cyclase